jgi:NodT family efflux transporter outer membrane factor (OMF) lipoprotein
MTMQIFIVRLSSGFMTLLLGAMLSGCAVGPDFKKPDAPTATGFSPQPILQETAAAPVTAGDAQKYNPAAAIPSDWWTLFKSPQINALIARAFKNSPTIQSAQASLRQAQQSVIAQQGYFFPTVGASYSPSRTKLAGNVASSGALGLQANGDVIAPAAAGEPVYYNFHVAQLSVGYVPDIFGGNRRQVESLQAQLQAQHFQTEATYITLASNIVAAALQEAMLRAQIKASQEIIRLNNENLEILHKQLELGYVAGIDVAAQEAAAAQAEQALIPLNKQLDQTRNLIRALAGNLPNEEVPEVFELESLQLPQELPLSLPSQLVEQRPDIRAAQEQWHAASAQVGVAEAGRFPQFTITAAVGGMATTPDWMFREGGSFFSLLGNVSIPLFDGGTLKAREQAAREGLAQAAADYRRVVITAFQNVADTLHAIQSDADYLKAALRSELALKETADLTRKQYVLGYVSYQTALLAEQNFHQAEINLIQAQATRLGDTAALYQALGGGWWNRQDDAQAQQPPAESDNKHTKASVPQTPEKSGEDAPINTTSNTSASTEGTAP